MAPTMLTNVTTYIDGHDWTCDTNQAQIDVEATELDVSTYCSAGYKDLIAGVKSLKFAKKGFWQAGSGQMDPEVFPNLGSRKTHTVATAGVEGSVAYLFQSSEMHYVPFEGAYGEASGFTIDSSGTDAYGAVRGQLVAAKQSVAATGAFGTACNLGDPGGTKYVYASLHVFSPATSITVRIESDTASNFPSAATVGTFTAQTAAGGVWLPRVLGTSGELWYRANCTALSGGPATVAVGIAVQ